MKNVVIYCLSALCILMAGLPAAAQHPVDMKPHQQKQSIRTGAERLDEYLPLLAGKRIALLVNQTSIVGNSHLLDVLLKEGVNVVKIFVPEHGFRGTADAGAHIKSGTDEATGLPVISLYGANKKPKKEQLADVDVVLYDLQDVGVRFYTYISSLEYLMQACREENKQLIVLDRPNPHGHYVDGPVLEAKHRSFVGMQQIPVVYGMTPGEYALMLKGEGWIENSGALDLRIIPCTGYNHKTLYTLPVPPSPNLRNMAAIYLYPSLCFFEGTVVSVGRGTDKPFQQWGHPAFKDDAKYFFVPKSLTGASKPLLEGQKCYGMLLADSAGAALAYINDRLRLEPLITAYKWYPEKKKFFNNFLEKLTGTAQIREMIEQGKTEQEIRAGWQKDLVAFKDLRRKYLLYPDFE